MKKYLLFITLVLFSIGMNAQNNTNVNQNEEGLISEKKTTSLVQEDRLMTKGFSFGDLERLNIKTIRTKPKENDIIGAVQNEAGERLIGAHVILYNGDRFISGTISSIYGVYELVLKNNATEIEISYLGYQPIRESVAYFLDNPIAVLKEGIDLETVVVTADKELSTGMKITTCGGYPPLHCLVFKPDSTFIKKEKIKDNKFKGWQVYPNPTIDRITVKTVFSEGVFKLLAANGQVLKLIPVQELQTEINLDGYPAGSYYLRYESETWVETFGPVLKVGM